MVRKPWDKLDQQLIQELQKDGRQSYRNLARQLGVAEGTVRKRAKSLQSKNVIKIAALPDPRKLGYNFICMVGLKVRLAELYRVGKELVQIPNVYYLASVAGQFDLLAILLFHSSEELADFVREKIATMSGVERIETFVNMGILKSPWADGLDVAELLKF